ncbi:unnamed protein product, partial [Discosporangium mesarthrocarpum]
MRPSLGLNEGPLGGSWTCTQLSLVANSSGSLPRSRLCRINRLKCCANADKQSRPNDVNPPPWPWILEKPARFITELPGEVLFTGFGRMDGLDDDLSLDIFAEPATPSGEDLLASSKVSREVRGACHSPVALDPCPNPCLVALSPQGARLVGVPVAELLKGMAQVGERLKKLGEGNSELDGSNEEGYRGGRSGMPGASGGALGLRFGGAGPDGGGSPVLHEATLYLSGSKLPENSKPFAACYGGHQFGNWVGQLGDGRVATLGEVRARSRAPWAPRCSRGGWGAVGPDGGTGALGGGIEALGGNVIGSEEAWSGQLVEIQIKGGGKTPFSRGGDGKAVLSSCLKEFIMSEALLGLGLPAVPSVSVCLTGETMNIAREGTAWGPSPTPPPAPVPGPPSRAPRATRGGSESVVRGRSSVARERRSVAKSPRAVLCRVAPSFIRFGSFELPARRGEVGVVRKLADFLIRHLRPFLVSGDHPLIMAGDLGRGFNVSEPGAQGG